MVEIKTVKEIKGYKLKKGATVIPLTKSEGEALKDKLTSAKLIEESVVTGYVLSNESGTITLGLEELPTLRTFLKEERVKVWRPSEEVKKLVLSSVPEGIHNALGTRAIVERVKTYSRSHVIAILKSLEADDLVKRTVTVMRGGGREYCWYKPKATTPEKRKTETVAVETEESKRIHDTLRCEGKKTKELSMGMV